MAAHDDPPPFEKLTNDLLCLILKRVPPEEIVKMTRVCKHWDISIRHALTTVRTGGLVLTGRSDVMALYYFLAKTSSITCLDIEVAGAVVYRFPSILRLAPLSQLVEVTLATGTHSMNAFRDLVEGLSALQKLRTLRLFTYRMSGSLHARPVIP